ncbi:hypothetical protein FB45DRAFT_1066483 [Roridomyces roridus]|uniref:Uncharacterized protein n=1 Tax=Roridomyces roridus TaxID=1738132 RepID=A0AAD7FB59_9AGAR|nr:hypothetical protein FB45DRAFT_1066483 [Roridomyces roridus]
MSPTIPSTSPLPGQLGGIGGVGSTTGSGASAQLYLYTFLATLVLLFLVAGGILWRSSFIRRRNQRIVDEAIANGTWNPPMRYFPVDLKMKPKMWDAHIVPPLDSPPADWVNIMPFAGSYIPTATSSGSFATAFTSPHSVLDPSMPSLHAPRGNAQIIVEQPRMHVAFLIAMPVRPAASSSSASASSSSLAPSLDSAPTPPTPVWVSSMGVEDDEVPLPYLEMGNMAVNLVPAAPLRDGGVDEGGSGSDGEGSVGEESGSEEGSSVSQCGVDT